MKKLFLFLFIFSSFYVLGQKSTEFSDITTTKTKNHLNIPGTKLYMIPPPDFKLASSFLGLEKEDFTSLQIYDYKGTNFTTISQKFTKESLEKQSFKIHEAKEFKINDYQAKYYLTESSAETRTLFLVFGDESFSLMIMGILHHPDPITLGQVKEALKTIYYEKTVVETSEDLPFAFDENSSEFKFMKFDMGMYWYSVSGVDINLFDKEPVIMVYAQPTASEISVKEISELAFKNTNEQLDKSLKIKKQSTLKVNTYEAYEIEASGEFMDNDVVLYILVVKNKNQTILIQAIVKTDFEETLKAVKGFSKTIKIK